MSDDSSALLPRSLPPSPAFFVCLPRLARGEPLARPESFPGESPPLEAAPKSGSALRRGTRRGSVLPRAGTEGMCLRPSPPGASRVLFGVFLNPLPAFCCHFHYGFPFHPLSTSPRENNSMDLWPAKGYLSPWGGGTSRVNNAAAFSCSDRFRSRARAFYGSYFQSHHVRVLLWTPLCAEGRGEVPAPSRWGCGKGRALRECVQS